ncbi:MAG TPA: hypothetical protein PK869_10245 [Candidatus Hydrogenedentes bacterium]|nr:hypothetical protein [Candidatus Hydrogenedentota bacterium]
MNVPSAMQLLRTTGVTLAFIVAGFVFLYLTAPGPRRVRISAFALDMGAIRTSLAAYATDHGTYPPAYGYWVGDDRDGRAHYIHLPYIHAIEINESTKLYDKYAIGYDTNGDGVLSRLEYHSELGGQPNFTVDAIQSAAPYGGGPLLNTEAARPYVFVPYCKADLERMKLVIAEEKNLESRERLERGEIWDARILPDVYESANAMPPRLDAFVLLSVGASRDTGGLLTPIGDEDEWLAQTGVDPKLHYYVLALRAAYLATRDLNGNGLADFDARARGNSDGTDALG